MALLDSISLYSDSTIIAKWANGLYGVIAPTENNTYIFIEYEEIEGRDCLKYPISEREEKAPVLAFGFVSYWLRKRKRKTDRAKHLDLLPPEDGYKNPVAIFDEYIDARKEWFFNKMQERPDVWKYPNLEQLFYELDLTVEREKEFIHQSVPLFGYIDMEDIKEFFDVTNNFLEYIEYKGSPYVKKASIEEKNSKDADDGISSENYTEDDKLVLKVRIEMLNYLFAKLGKDTSWFTENRKGEAIKRIYKCILGNGTDRIIKENIGKVHFDLNDARHREGVDKANALLKDIDQDWMIDY